MSDLRDLYQEMILDHNRRPRNYGALADANRRLEGSNPLCGDQLTLYLKVEGDIVQEVSFLGSGCAISRASASLMTDAVKGRTVAEARALFERVHRMVTGTADPGEVGQLGKLSVLSGVCEFPVRIKCAILAWHTLVAALQGESGAVSTEK